MEKKYALDKRRKENNVNIRNVWNIADKNS